MNARVRISRGGVLQRLVNLEEGRTLVLGSHPACDIFINSEHVSIRHASIELTPGGPLKVQCLGARGRLLHNGRQVRKARLANGGIARVADLELRFEDFRWPVAAMSCPRVTLEIAPQRVGDPPRRIPLEPGRTILGGDAERADIYIPDEYVSGQHAELLLDPWGVRLTDLGSSNGTLVDGREARDAALKDGQTIHLSPQTSLALEINKPVDPVVEGSLLTGKVLLASILAVAAVTISFYISAQIRPAPRIDNSAELYRKAYETAVNPAENADSPAARFDDAERILKKIIEGDKEYDRAASLLQELGEWRRNADIIRQNKEISAVQKRSLGEIEKTLGELALIRESDKANFEAAHELIAENLNQVYKTSIQSAREAYEEYKDFAVDKSIRSEDINHWRAKIFNCMNSPIPSSFWTDNALRDEAKQLAGRAQRTYEHATALSRILEMINQEQLSASHPDFDKNVEIAIQLIQTCQADSEQRIYDRAAEFSRYIETQKTDRAWLKTCHEMKRDKQWKKLRQEIEAIRRKGIRLPPNIEELEYEAGAQCRKGDSYVAELESQPSKIMEAFEKTLALRSLDEIDAIYNSLRQIESRNQEVLKILNTDFSPDEFRRPAIDSARRAILRELPGRLADLRTRLVRLQDTPTSAARALETLDLLTEYKDKILNLSKEQKHQFRYPPLIMRHVESAYRFYSAHYKRLEKADARPETKRPGDTARRVCLVRRLMALYVPLAKEHGPLFEQVQNEQEQLYRDRSTSEEEASDAYRLMINEAGNIQSKEGPERRQAEDRMVHNALTVLNSVPIDDLLVEETERSIAKTQADESMRKITDVIQKYGLRVEDFHLEGLPVSAEEYLHTLSDGDPGNP